MVVLFLYACKLDIYFNILNIYELITLPHWKPASDSSVVMIVGSVGSALGIQFDDTICKKTVDLYLSKSWSMIE